MKLSVTISPPRLGVEIKPPGMEATTGIPVARDYVERPAYEGPYEVTPGPEAQTLSTKHLRMTDDVVVGAIPQNYGLITWNGSTLTVS